MATTTNKPVILAVDDDAPVLRAVERDLRSRYGKEYRIVAATSGAEALEAVRQLTVCRSTSRSLRRWDSAVAF